MHGGRVVDRGLFVDRPSLRRRHGAGAAIRAGDRGLFVDRPSLRLAIAAVAMAVIYISRSLRRPPFIEAPWGAGPGTARSSSRSLRRPPFIEAETIRVTPDGTLSISRSLRRP